MKRSADKSVIAKQGYENPIMERKKGWYGSSKGHKSSAGESCFFTLQVPE